MLVIADENVPESLVRLLRKMGVDVYRVTELGLGGASDYEILRFANEHAAVVLTMDVRDFARLHRDGLNETGIIIVCAKSIRRSVFQTAERIRQVLEDLGGMKPWICFV